jgi:predicted transcriptional regulator
MKKIYLCALMMLLANLLFAQENHECDDLMSDDKCLRYTASGCQTVINGNHSKAINESRKMADISAQSELSKMVTSVVSHVAENFISETSSFSDKNIDTTLISSYKILKGMKTVCRSKTKLVGNMYVTYITKEISLDDISDMLDFNNDDDRNEFKKMLMK